MADMQDFGDFKLRISNPGVKAIYRSPEVKAAIAERSRAVAKNANSFGGKFGSDTKVSPIRSVGLVYPLDKKARKATYEQNALEKAKWM
jgi:hypothetical protein